MNLNAETIIVAIVVGAAMLWGVRSIYRSYKKGTVCSSCSDSCDCPLTKPGQDLTDLKDLDPPQNCQKSL